MPGKYEGRSLMFVKKWANGVLSPLRWVIKTSGKTGGANVNPINGIYEVAKQEGVDPKFVGHKLFIKAETDKRKEFSELLSGTFLKRVIAQPEFKYKDNFALAEAGLAPDDKAPNEPPQIIMIQDLAPARDAIHERKKLQEFRDKLTFSDKSMNALKQADHEELAAALVLSMLIADYSVHTGNFMITPEGKLLRIDFGSSFRGICNPDDAKSYTKSPSDTKWYKKYIEDWTGDKELKMSLTMFMEDNPGFLDPPDKIVKMMGEAIDELFETVYKDAPLEDLLEIYSHLHGEDYSDLTKTQIDLYHDITSLKDQINTLQEELVKLEAIAPDKRSKKEKNKLIEISEKITTLNQECAEKSAILNKKDASPDDKRVYEKTKENVKTAIKSHMKASIETRVTKLVQDVKALDKQSPSERLKVIDKQIESETKKLEDDKAQLQSTSLYLNKHLQELDSEVSVSEQPWGDKYCVVGEQNDKKYITEKSIDAYIEGLNKRLKEYKQAVKDGGSSTEDPMELLMKINEAKKLKKALIPYIVSKREVALSRHKIEQLNGRKSALTSKIVKNPEAKTGFFGRLSSSRPGDNTRVGVSSPQSSIHSLPLKRAEVVQAGPSGLSASAPATMPTQEQKQVINPNM